MAVMNLSMKDKRLGKDDMQVLGISHILTYLCTYVLTYAQRTTNLFLIIITIFIEIKLQILQTFATEFAAIFFSKISNDVIIIPAVHFVPTHGPTLGLTYISRR